MIFGSYRIEIPFETLRRYKRLLLQFPAGLKRYARDIAEIIEENTPSEIFISADSCFGACDLPIGIARSLNVDLIVQFGHLPIPGIKTDIPVIFVNAIQDIDVKKVCRVIEENVEERKISIVTTAQHIEYLDNIKRDLENIGFEVYINRGDIKRIYKEGLVLGCNFSASMNEKAESIVFIGTGNFHPIGISLSTSKPVYSIDPISLTVRDPNDLDLDKKKLIKKRYALISLARDAEKFGIIVSSKPGQRRLDVATRIKREIEETGKKAYIIAMDDILSENIKDFGKFDCLISTACPRIAIDDSDNFNIPVLTVPEFEILIGKRNIENYVFDTISSVQNSQ